MGYEKVKAELESLNYDYGFRMKVVPRKWENAFISALKKGDIHFVEKALYSLRFKFFSEPFIIKLCSFKNKKLIKAINSSTANKQTFKNVIRISLENDDIETIKFLSVCRLNLFVTIPITFKHLGSDYIKMMNATETAINLRAYKCFKYIFKRYHNSLTYDELYEIIQTAIKNNSLSSLKYIFKHDKRKLDPHSLSNFLVSVIEYLNTDLDIFTCLLNNGATVITDGVHILDRTLCARLDVIKYIIEHNLMGGCVFKRMDDHMKRQIKLMQIL